MSRHVIVELDANEISFLAEIAHYRNDPKIGVVTNRRVDPARGDLHINMVGLIAEYAVAKLFKVRINTDESLSGDGGVKDLQIYGRAVQVKYNHYPDGPLYFNSTSQFKADAAFLCVPAPKAMSPDFYPIKVCGYIDREVFMRICKPCNWGYGERCGVTQVDLFPFWFFKKKEESDEKASND